MVVGSVFIQSEGPSVIVSRTSLLAEGQCSFLTSLIASDTRRTLRDADGSRTSTAVNIPLAAGIPPAGTPRTDVGRSVSVTVEAGFDGPLEPTELLEISESEAAVLRKAIPCTMG